jgi:hypothetical protein
MAGDSNCTWHWSSKPGDRKPGVPWCGFFFPDCTPVHIAELAAMRRYAGLPDNSIILEGFDNPEERSEAGDNSFKTYNDGKLGELRHSGKSRDYRIFQAKAEGAWDAQVFMRLEDGNAAGGIALYEQADSGESPLIEVTIRENGVCVFGSRLDLFVARDLSAGIEHNLKISNNRNNVMTIWVDDLSRPCLVIDAAIKTTTVFALFAEGNTAFDDFAVLKAGGGV